MNTVTKLRNSLRQWLLDPLGERIIGALNGAEARIKNDVFAYINQHSSERMLATVTVLCDVVSHSNKIVDGEQTFIPGTDRSVMGGEVWLMPGQTADVVFVPQRPVSNMCFFVSGHPNIVVKGFKVGNEWCDADNAGKKFGEIDRKVAIGMRMCATVHYAKEPQQ